MRRGTRVFGAMLVVAHVVVGTAAADLGPPIQSIVGPGVEVCKGPEYLAVGDVDNDGLADVVATCVDDHVIATALSDGGGAFRRVASMNLGRPVGAVALTFANTDRALDIVATDLTILSLGGGVFSLAGSGDARFGMPSYVDATTRAAAITTADFDGDGALDLATANGFRTNPQTKDDDVTVILNRGHNSGFDPGIPYSVEPGAEPTDIDTADFDGDGTVDIVVLNRKPGTSSEIVVLPTRSGGPWICPFTFPGACGPFATATGLSPVALVAEDFNDDGVADLAVANANPDQRALSISVVRTEARNLAGVPRGTGVLTPLPPVDVSCPTNMLGVAVTCAITDIAAADFNRDGFNDVVVSIKTSAADAEVLTPSILVFYHGLGDGRLEWSSSVHVGSGVAAIGVGDFNGDAAPDVVVAEERGDTLSIVRMLLPEGSPVGCSCRKSPQCESDHCVDGVCCQIATCEGELRCDIPGHEGECASPLPLSAPCTDDDHCTSGQCTDGVCCEVDDCGSGRSCAVIGGEGECREATTTGPTPTPDPSGGCVGDCDGDRHVTVEELVAMVAIVLGEAPSSMCRGLPIMPESHASVADVVAAVANALLGCASGRSR